MSKKPVYRVFAIVLAILMLAGLLYSAFYSIFHASADGDVTFFPIVTDHMIRVAKKFKFSTIDCRVFSQTLESTGDLGLNLYSKVDGDPLPITISPVKILITKDKYAHNAASGLLSAASYDGTTSSYSYSPLCFVSDESYATADEFSGAVQDLPDVVKAMGCYMFVTDTGYRIGAGSGLSENELAEKETLLSENGVENFKPYSGSETVLAVLDSQTLDVLFKIETTSLRLYVYPVQPNGGAQTYYLMNEVTYSYAGDFEYRCDEGGITMINTLDLEDYVKGILPYEVDPEWPYESLKTFAIILRSYTMGGYYVKHPHDDYDFCDESHCQAYRGLKRANATTAKAVDDTKGMICAYEGKPALTFYHAISGGSTISYNDAWDWSATEYPYLVSVDTPWEPYEKWSNGLWTTVVSRAELSDYLMAKTKIAKKLKDGIADLTISRYLENGYAYELTLTDIYGTKAVYRQSDEVRNILQRYVKSALFTVSKKPLETTLVSVNTPDNSVDLATEDLYVISADENGETSVSKLEDAPSVLSASGTTEITSEDFAYVITGKGWGHGVGISQYAIDVMVKQGYKYDEIIKAYFPTLDIVNMSDIGL